MIWHLSSSHLFYIICAVNQQCPDVASIRFGHFVCFSSSCLDMVGWQEEHHPACKKLSDEVLAWLSVWGDVQICIWPWWCHCHSLFVASVNPDWFYLPGFTFWYWLTRVVPDKIQKGHKMVVVTVAVVVVLLWHWLSQVVLEKRPLKGIMCAHACVCVHACMCTFIA